MIRFIQIKNKDFVSATDFHNLLGLSDNHYSRNVKKWLFETDYLFQGEMEILNPRKDEDYYSPRMESEGKHNHASSNKPIYQRTKTIKIKQTANKSNIIQFR